ncbi:Rv3235 family protein [Nocardia sp. CDC159]|uniref:Rv3235 family protein n=1 Tax=Nocardia pulmonis TaxID=2951408 RepID=A0A9X2E7T8_9NOCA|nr:MULTISPECIES: Rv3235 family protein [Nocardia]MCM6775712.1 Rv3235 family protein [Nocardia pulmonis]MCM6788312.1 Rv3235 family protein [Nocardia sp. CDC159]
MRFAERSLRLVLEALDGRRSAAQLARLVDPTVAATLATLIRTGAAERRLGPAVLVAVRTEPIGPGVAEVVAGYERGGRRFAIAARAACRRGEWRLVALRLR